MLRWRYHAGNNWGCDSPNDCGIGKGYQEEFVNCADISIYKGKYQIGVQLLDNILNLTCSFLNGGLI